MRCHFSCRRQGEKVCVKHPDDGPLHNTAEWELLLCWQRHVAVCGRGGLHDALLRQHSAVLRGLLREFPLQDSPCKWCVAVAFLCLPILGSA
jgi:hypothetical protein